MKGSFLDAAELQKRRTPIELRDYVNELRDSARKDDAVWHQGMLRSGLFKQLIQEIIPVKDYVLHRYRNEDVLVSPVLGNQGYDAEVFDSTNRLIERIEVTAPYDGEYEVIDTRLAIKRGYGKMRIYSPGENVRKLKTLVLKAAEAKSKKDYSDSTLLIVLELRPPSPESSTRTAYQTELDLIIKSLKLITFCANKVVMQCPEGHMVAIHG